MYNVCTYVQVCICTCTYIYIYERLQVDGWIDGWIDGWTDGQTDGWMDGWMDREAKRERERERERAIETESRGGVGGEQSPAHSPGARKRALCLQYEVRRSMGGGGGTPSSSP